MKIYKLVTSEPIIGSKNTFYFLYRGSAEAMSSRLAQSLGITSSIECIDVNCVNEEEFTRVLDAALIHN